MSNELVKQDDFTHQLAEFDKIQETCSKLMKTKHYANLGEIGIHTIMARAKTLGIHPFEALNGNFYVVHGKVGMSTEMMAALVRKRGHSIRKDNKSNNEICILHGKRADTGDEWTCSFSRQDAQAAGLWDSVTWKKYPGVMLYNRCMSMLFRQLFPDLSLGTGYVEDELREITRTGEYKESITIPVENVEYVKPLYIEKTESEIEYLDVEQSREIKNILSDCLEEFNVSFHELIKKRFDAIGVQDIPKASFEAVRNHVLDLKKKSIEKKEQEFKQPSMQEVMDG